MGAGGGCGRRGNRDRGGVTGALRARRTGQLPRPAPRLHPGPESTEGRARAPGSGSPAAANPGRGKANTKLARGRGGKGAHPGTGDFSSRQLGWGARRGGAGRGRGSEAGRYPGRARSS